MNTVWKLILIAASAALVALTGCNSGGGSSLAGIGGTGKVASGTITGFGSIFVNGVEYNLDSATIEVDESPALENQLRLGMVVTVNGTVSDSTGTASSVVYDSELEGPVAALTTSADGTSKRFVALGVIIVVDATGTVFDDSTPGFSFDTLAEGDVVEVSGFFDANGILRASYLDKTGILVPGSTEVQLKGTASNAGAGAGLNDSFSIGTITVNVQPTADLSGVPGGLVTDGMFVEVKGIWVSGNAINASRIELEDSSLGDDGDDVSLEGLVSRFSGDLSAFLVNGQPVDASTASFEPASLQLANDLKVEVEGTINSNGVLVADSVEARSGDIEVQAVVTSKAVTNTSLNEGSVTLLLVNNSQPLTVQTNSRTQFEDKTGTLDTLRLSDIGTGDYLEISGFLDGGGAVVASEVRREDASGEEVILQGPVSSWTTDNSVTILGVTFTTSVTGTEFRDDLDLPLTSSAFYGELSTGTLVKIKDDNVPGDGIADEASLED